MLEAVRPGNLAGMALAASSVTHIVHCSSDQLCASLHDATQQSGRKPSAALLLCTLDHSGATGVCTICSHTPRNPAICLCWPEWTWAEWHIDHARFSDGALVAVYVTCTEHARFALLLYMQVPLSKLKDSFNDGTSIAYIEELEQRYKADPSSVDKTWGMFFRALGGLHAPVTCCCTSHGTSPPTRPAAALLHVTRILHRLLCSSASHEQLSQ